MMLVFENNILRRVCGPVRDEVTGDWRRRHNTELRELSGLPPITNYIRSQRLRWAGHVARRDHNSLIKGVEAGRPAGRRPVGRPRMRWSDNIVRDLEHLEVENPAEWRAKAQDREEWHLLVIASKDQMGPPAAE